MFVTRCTDRYSVREAFEGSTVLITGATGLCRVLPADTFAFNARLSSSATAGYIGGLVLEQLLRVGHIGKVSSLQHALTK